jgi:hypothetical protein
VRAGEQYRALVSARTSYDAWKAEGRDEVDVARQWVADTLTAREDWRPALSDDQLRALAEVCGVEPER